MIKHVSLPKTNYNIQSNVQFLYEKKIVTEFVRKSIEYDDNVFKKTNTFILDIMFI